MNDTFRNYANAFNYTAAGAVSAMRLGNGLWETTQFNSRLQPTMIGLGTGSAVQNRLRLDYAYGEMQSSGAIDPTKNNGNLTRQTISFAGLTNPFVQTYSYDSLNRLKSAVETQNTAQTWKQTFTFDRYGNRRFDTANNNTTTLLPNCPVAVCNPTISTSDNRLTSTGWQYDNAGNTTNDPQGRTFIYDAENKQVKVKDSQNQTIGEYFYNGDGQRIKKIVPSTGETTIFVYDASNKLVAEYSTIVEPSATAKTSYLTQDHLGSPRILTDQTGAVISRRDFLPFGEEIASGTGGRTTAQGYGGADSIRQKFTGYERDNESELDFAQARYYNSQHGRFTSVDPEGAGAFAENPQTWNAYAYVGNNPLNITDPDGLSWYFNPSIGEAGHYKWYEDNETPAEGYRLVIGVGNHVYYAGEDVGYVALNPFAKEFQTFDTREAALNRVEDIYTCSSCQELVNSVAENAEEKARTVRMAATAGVAAGVCIGTAGTGCPAAIKVASDIIESEISTAQENRANATIEPPGFGPGWVRLKGGQGFKDPDGNIWKKDMKHKDHWDVSDRKGNKVKEVDFDGRKIWPGGPKNKNKR